MALVLKIFKAGMLPAIALAFMLSLACGRGEAAGKALVVYFSWSGNTEALAKEIQAQTGADIFRIETVEPYPEDYNATVDQGRAEQRANARPALKQAKIDNLAEYDTIFIGAPNWWSSIPMPVAAFLEANDFSGKTVAQFVTHGGGGTANCDDDLRKLCPGAKFTEVLSIGGSSARSAKGEVTEWLSAIGFTK
ncbi:flavodoxin [Cloacibacillus sp. An23]|uniref:flavodoxin n=1 Tax=Cloacibacillus sp. An23 TaxID=1965591 RepID=UPI000B369793|nr:flavodoxin [Cloacibacillus sp. An23]